MPVNPTISFALVRDHREVITTYYSVGRQMVKKIGCSMHHTNPYNDNSNTWNKTLCTLSPPLTGGIPTPPILPLHQYLIMKISNLRRGEILGWNVEGHEEFGNVDALLEIGHHGQHPAKNVIHNITVAFKQPLPERFSTVRGGRDNR